MILNNYKLVVLEEIIEKYTKKIKELQGGEK